jgi:cobaltochelatase CobS
MAYEHGGGFLFDEMDKSNPNILATLNQAVANGSCSFPDARVKKHPDFFLFGAGNTWGSGATSDFVGSMKLDAATMNRYVKLHCERDADLERDLVAAIAGAKAETWVLALATVRKNIADAGLKVFCTMRDAINGAHLVDAGWTPRQAITDTVTPGLDEGQTRKVLAGV